MNSKMTPTKNKRMETIFHLLGTAHWFNINYARLHTNIHTIIIIGEDI